MLEEDTVKQEEFCDLDREQYLDSILENLTPQVTIIIQLSETILIMIVFFQDVRLLVHAEDEISQAKVKYVAHLFENTLLRTISPLGSLNTPKWMTYQKNSKWPLTPSPLPWLWNFCCIVNDPSTRLKEFS